MLIQNLLRIPHLKTDPKTHSQHLHPAKQVNTNHLRKTNVKKTYTFEERHAASSEPVITAFCQALLKQPQNEEKDNFYRSLQQYLNRTRHLSQNQNLKPTIYKDILFTPDAKGV